MGLGKKKSLSLCLQIVAAAAICQEVASYAAYVELVTSKRFYH